MIRTKCKADFGGLCIYTYCFRMGDNLEIRFRTWIVFWFMGASIFPGVRCGIAHTSLVYTCTVPIACPTRARSPLNRRMPCLMKKNWQSFRVKSPVSSRSEDRSSLIGPDSDVFDFNIKFCQRCEGGEVWQTHAGVAWYREPCIHVQVRKVKGLT